MLSQSNYEYDGWRQLFQFLKIIPNSGRLGGTLTARENFQLPTAVIFNILLSSPIMKIYFILQFRGSNSTSINSFHANVTFLYHMAARKIKFSRKLRIWSYLQKKSLMENFIFCVQWSAVIWIWNITAKWAEHITFSFNHNSTVFLTMS